MRLLITLMLSIIFFCDCGTSNSITDSNKAVSSFNDPCHNNQLSQCLSTKGCYWSTGPGNSAGVPSGCLSIQYCSQASSSVSCTGAISPATGASCSWSASTGCTDPSTAISQSACTSATTKASCLVSYTTQGPCFWVSTGAYANTCQQDTSTLLNCSAVVSTACSTGGFCTWGRNTSSPCQVNAPLHCTLISGNCCAAGSGPCTQTDPACIEITSGGTVTGCQDRSQIACSPDGWSSLTSCSLGNCYLQTQDNCTRLGCIWNQSAPVGQQCVGNPTQTSAACSLVSESCYWN